MGLTCAPWPVKTKPTFDVFDTLFALTGGLSRTWQSSFVVEATAKDRHGKMLRRDANVRASFS